MKANASNSELGDILLARARASVGAQLGIGDTWEPTRLLPALSEPAATFVTIELDGHLHGCIGTLAPRRTLAEDVEHNALAAAFNDPRSRALLASELPRARFSVAVLDAPTLLPFRDRDHALAQLRPRVDGLIFTWRGRRGVFLPQVWDVLPEPEDFLAELARKAGHERGFWHPEVVLERFCVTKYAEPRPRSGAPR